jgi:hypothetical protein
MVFGTVDTVAIFLVFNFFSSRLYGGQILGNRRSIIYLFFLKKYVVRPVQNLKKYKLGLGTWA